MGDDNKDPKPPNTVDGMPQDIKDFLECRANELVLKPGKQAWMKNIPTVGDALEYAEIEFDENKDGSIKVTAKLGMSTSVNMKVDGDGQLSIDASDSTMLQNFQKNIDEWTHDLNNWFKHKGKKLGKPKYKPGRRTLTLTKEDVPAATAPKKEGGVKEHGFLPSVPIGEKIGAGVVFGLAVLGSVALLPSDHTSVHDVTQTVAVTPATLPAATPVTDAPATTASPTIGDACIGVNHVAPGQYSLLQFYFTSQADRPGTWHANVGQTPTGGLSGMGSVDAQGHGEIDVKIFQFGQYNGLTLTDAQGASVPIGPFASMLPFTVTSTPKTCDANALKVPAPTTSPAVSTPSAPLEASKTETVTRQERTTEHGGAPTSLLLVPGAAALLGGGLILDEERRRSR